MGTGNVLNSRSLPSLEVCKGPVEGKGDPTDNYRNIALGLSEPEMFLPHVDLGN